MIEAIVVMVCIAIGLVTLLLLAIPPLLDTDAYFRKIKREAKPKLTIPEFMYDRMSQNSLSGALWTILFFWGGVATLSFLLAGIAWISHTLRNF